MRFEYVLGLFIALKKQLEDENKEREKQEKEATGGKEISMSNYSGQVNSMLQNAKSQMNIPNMPNISMPHF